MVTTGREKSEWRMKNEADGFGRQKRTKETKRKRRETECG
jgi:hypothetical protein